MLDGYIIKIMKADNLSVELLELLDEASFNGFRDSELMDNIAGFREEISIEPDKKKQYQIIGNYVIFLRRIFRDYPEVMK